MKTVRCVMVDSLSCVSHRHRAGSSRGRLDRNAVLPRHPPNTEPEYGRNCAIDAGIDRQGWKQEWGPRMAAPRDSKNGVGRIRGFGMGPGSEDRSLLSTATSASPPPGAHCIAAFDRLQPGKARNWQSRIWHPF